MTVANRNRSPHTHTSIKQTHPLFLSLQVSPHHPCVALTQQPLCAPPLCWRWLYSAVQLLCYPATLLAAQAASAGLSVLKGPEDDTNMLQHMLLLLTLPLCTDSANFLLLLLLLHSPVLSSPAAAPPLLNFHEPPQTPAECVCVCGV